MGAVCEECDGRSVRSVMGGVWAKGGVQRGGYTTWHHHAACTGRNCKEFPLSHVKAQGTRHVCRLRVKGTHTYGRTATTTL